ncbi:hypothetical protein [Phytoactinopolyspora halotolerans]|uniref:Uncharacterized protein n=1 Tax=Phytoactinopolyspora halotolerans TaxID=1981512 RepID=A0A6L9SEE8_9ACTN|nr:hypothetical protein [Phytoactinopolyspora halotolerans]NEE03449.1 hypothetical protein [Phytoactinopolyspora halotolerans]
MSQSSSWPRKRITLVVGWMLLAAGIIGSAVPLGLTQYSKAQGSDVGPDQAVTWPSDEPAVIVPHGERPSSSNECIVTPQHGEPRHESMRWGLLAHPHASGTATLTCEHAGVFVTGTSANILSMTYSLGVLIAFMMFIGLIGLVFVVPRLAVVFSYQTTLWDRLSGRAARREAEEHNFLR